MDRCKFCDVQFKKREAIQHIEQCTGERICQFKELSHRLADYIKYQLRTSCFYCHESLNNVNLFTHLRQHPRCMFLIDEVMKYFNLGLDTTFCYCIICGEETLSKQALLHLGEHHPDTLSRLYFIAEKVIASEPREPRSISCRICDILFLRTKLVDFLVDYKAESVILVHLVRQQTLLAAQKKITLQNMTSCRVCGDQFPFSKSTDHLAAKHPEAMHLMEKIFNYSDPNLDRPLRLKCIICNQRISNKCPATHFELRHPTMWRLHKRMEAGIDITLKKKKKKLPLKSHIKIPRNLVVKRIMKAPKTVKKEVKQITPLAPKTVLKEVKKITLLASKTVPKEVKKITPLAPTTVIKEVKKRTPLGLISRIATKKKSSRIDKLAKFYLRRALLYKKKNVNENTCNDPIKVNASVVPNLNVHRQPFVLLTRLHNSVFEEYKTHM